MFRRSLLAASERRYSSRERAFLMGYCCCFCCIIDLCPPLYVERKKILLYETNITLERFNHNMRDEALQVESYYKILKLIMRFSRGTNEGGRQFSYPFRG